MIRSICKQLKSIRLRSMFNSKVSKQTCRSFILSGNSFASISFRTRVSIAVQMSSRKSDLVSSDRIESQMRRTSGNGNSCDSIKVSHLGRKEGNFCSTTQDRFKNRGVKQGFFEVLYCPKRLL